MSDCVSPFPFVGRNRLVGVAALALMIAIAGSAGNAAAQQAPAKKAAPASPGAAPAGRVGSWVKLCDKTPVGTMFREGKEEVRYGNICRTLFENVDGTTGVTVVAAAVRQVDGVDKQFLTATIPLGMTIPAGVRATLYPGDLWDKALKNEKIDETKLKGVTLEYTMCQPAGCSAEMEATPALLNDLKTFKGIVFFAINASREVVTFPVPLTGFDKAHAGGPADLKQYVEGHKALQQQIAKRQQEALQQKKAAEQRPGPPAATPKN
jgi:invasion protein IalB